MKTARPDGLKALRRPSADENHGSFSALPVRTPSGTPKFLITEWLAPIIVWAAVIWTMLAAVSILFGED